MQGLPDEIAEKYLLILHLNLQELKNNNHEPEKI
jgi:hypothetical protein